MIRQSTATEARLLKACAAAWCASFLFSQGVAVLIGTAVFLLSRERQH
jgi:hypothetical protein